MPQASAKVVSNVFFGIAALVALSVVPGLLGKTPRLAGDWLATLGLAFIIAALALRIRGLKPPK
jgi:hypothetical protein